jgi:murein DD-endopeptidase MepM/ murein hydrolase activator NlpD
MSGLQPGTPRLLALGVLLLTLSACANVPVATPSSVAPSLIPPTPTVVPATSPALAPTPTWTAVPALPGLLAAFPTAESTDLPLAVAPPPYQAPWAIQPHDHFYLGRPIPSDHAYRINSEYRYGNTDSGNEPTHTGVDIVADRGTPVVAAGDGEVIWTGYGLYRGVHDLSDPYGLAVAIRHDFGYQGQTLYTVYAHLDRIDVWLGQHVHAGDQLGIVGMTGHASGPHLHFEVRLGENRYFNTRNPELWMVSPRGWGVLAGRIMDTLGRPLDEAMVQITSKTTGRVYDVLTYAPDTVHPDDYYGEDFVVSDLPAGVYEVYISFTGHPFTTELYVHPGMTNLVAFAGRHGFIAPEPSAPVSSKPPSS